MKLDPFEAPAGYEAVDRPVVDCSMCCFYVNNYTCAYPRVPNTSAGCHCNNRQDGHDVYFTKRAPELPEDL